MKWAIPRNSPKSVDLAGRTLADDGVSTEAREYALYVISNWRACHAFPLNTFQNGLRTKAKAVDKRSLIAQRIKRMRSIELKLRNMRHLRLSQMQDIGGCRAVVRSVHSAQGLVQSYKQSRIKHELVREDDYIVSPRPSGYRRVHLVYRYYGRNAAYDGLRIEIQIRSRLQHAWATAVETVGMFRGEALKSGLGDADWLRFFALMGTVIAEREKSPPVPGTPGGSELVGELREFYQKLNIAERLTGYRTALTILPQRLRAAHYFLLEFDRRKQAIRVRGYGKRHLEEASRDYLERERESLKMAEVDAVLVSADSLNAIKRAYPNYFLDTRTFLDEVNRALR